MYFVTLKSLSYVIATITAAACASAGGSAASGASGLNSRSVNVNLETVFEFDPKDNAGDVAFIDNVQQFLGKVKTVINHKSGRRSHQTPKSPKIEKFTDFISEVVKILKTYSDSDLKDVVAVVDDESRKYHYEGCKFHELVQNVDLRRFVANKLSSVQNKQGKDIRNSLNDLLDALEDGKFDYRQVEFLDYVNSLYRSTDMGKMESFLNEIKTYRVKSKRTNLSLVRIVRNGIRNIIFDHYSNLNPNARKEFRIKLDTFWSTAVETTTEATTTKKMFNIANGFDFLKDFTFEFITPETFAKKPNLLNKTLGAALNEPENSTQTTIKGLFADLTKLKNNNNPEEIANNTDNEKLKDEESKKGKHYKKKVKRERKKNKRHKSKKTHYRKQVTDKKFSPEKKHTHKKYKSEEALKSKHKFKKHKNKHVTERKHKSKHHRSDPVYRQHDATKPAHIFDYKAVINVKRETEKSYSSELSKPNESISIERQKTTSRKKSKGYRRYIASKSEEGLSIEFKHMPLSLTLINEQTTKRDETLLKRLNNVEKVSKTYHLDKNANNKQINVTNNEKISTVKITEKKKMPEILVAKLKNVENDNSYQTRENLSNFRAHLSTVEELRHYNNTQTNEGFYGPHQYLTTTNKKETTKPTPKELKNTASEATKNPSKYSETNKTTENKYQKVLRLNQLNRPKKSPNTHHNDVNNNNNVEETLDKLKSDNITSVNAVNMNKTYKIDDLKSDKNKNDNVNDIYTSTSVNVDDSTAVEVREKLNRQMKFYRKNKQNNFDHKVLL